MVHGPCGDHCIKNNKCSKGFPKEFRNETALNSETNYAQYQRRSPNNNGRTVSVQTGQRNRIIDNRWIVPYNPYLLLRYECHINVECCTSTKIAKYLYKYVTKGNSRAMVNASVDNGNEIDNYIDMRVVGSCEAAWRLLDYPIQQQ